MVKGVGSDLGTDLGGSVLRKLLLSFRCLTYEAVTATVVFVHSLLDPNATFSTYFYST